MNLFNLQEVMEDTSIQSLKVQELQLLIHNQNALKQKALLYQVQGIINIHNS